MRIRQVRPEFWKDDVMADLPSEVRLFYIGLWCVADDAGWIEWNTAAIGADLFPYTSRRVREGHVDKWAGELEAVRRIVRHGCGCVEIPRLPEHQKNGGTRITTAFDRHEKHASTDESVRVQTITDKSARANNANTTYTPTVTKGGPGGNVLPHLTDAVAAAWTEATGVTVIASGQFAIGYLDDACRRHPDAVIVGAILDARRGFANIPSTQQLTAALRAILDPFPDAKVAKAVASEQREADAGRRRVQATKRRNHDIGWHADEPDPMCDACRAVA